MINGITTDEAESIGNFIEAVKTKQSVLRNLKLNTMKTKEEIISNYVRFRVWTREVTDSDLVTVHECKRMMQQYASQFQSKKELTDKNKTMTKRVIKFRIFRDNKMIQLNEMHTSNVDDNCFQKSEDDGTIMQYTGLKDKNGKEIYEGDIVKGLSDNCYYEVEFFNGIFGTRIGAICTLELEVIGNKYENPELCEKI